MAVFKVIQNTFGQAEFRDAVPQHAADFIVAFKNGHIIAIARQNDRNGQARRAGADDGRLFAVGGHRAVIHLAGIGGRDVVFDNRKMHRGALDAAHAVTLALLFVVAHQAAHRGKGIVFKQHAACFVQLVGFQQADHFGDIGLDGAPLLAARLFAAQTLVGFVHDM